MTTQIICLLIGCLIPLIWSGAALPYRQRQLGRVDFEQPRVQANSLTGRGASVVGAQMNSWEALILFAVANLCGHFGELDPLGAVEHFEHCLGSSAPLPWILLFV